MKEIVLIFFIILFVVSVITYPFKLKGALHINVIENIGFAVIKVFNIRLFNAKFKVASDGHFAMEKEKEKKQKKKNKELHRLYFMCLAKKIDLKKSEFFFTTGSTSDACLVSLIGGYINVFVSSVIAVLMTKYKHMKSFVNIEPDYQKDRIEMTASAVISFSLLDMFVSIMCALINYKKEKRGKKNA